ncbi:hypothetical protein JCGZ_03112 [Jatropha curcas]|uniref:Uncharacterized protein n=1 Tax=Jatropha curcas TaxID=180498 RepID=A0A067JDU2_JATCU|nr:hypothetical protein JCGZ_03112 [Jatropha curcas]
MAPKKSKSTKMAKVTEAIKKKAAAKGSGKDVPSVVPDTQLIGIDTSTGATQSELPPLSPTAEPPRKRQREAPIPTPPPVPLMPLDIRGYFM